MFRRLSTVNRVLNYNIIRSAGGFSKVASVIPNFTAPVYRRECELTRLDNEITVSTVESGSHMNSVSLYIKTGSRYETEENNGANFLLQHAGFFVGFFFFLFYFIVESFVFLLYYIILYILMVILIFFYFF